MFKKPLLLLFFCIFYYSGFSQNEVANPNISLLEKVPQSPNAGSLGRYIEVPVSMATGLPNIEIPLYTIQVGRITIPIILSYHSGGVKVNDEGSWVGLGWTLAPGGTVTRQPNGLDDFYATAMQSGSTSPTRNYIDEDMYYSYNPLGFTSITQAMDSVINAPGYMQDTLDRFMGMIITGTYDGEADQYFYSTPEGSGSFAYNQKLNKYQNDKINGWSIGGASGDWFISTNDGKRYDFAEGETYLNPLFPKSLSTQQYLESATHLSVIHDYVTNQDVTFSYVSEYREVLKGFSVTKDYKHNGSSQFPYFRGNEEEIVRKGWDKTLSVIAFPEGRVEFIQDTSSRLDGGPKCLKQIKVYNSKNVLLKQFDFTYFNLTSSYLSGTQYNCYTNSVEANRTFLNSVQETDFDFAGESYAKDPYRFRYDTSIKLPCRFSFAQDFWGYYNGKHSNNTIIPTIYFVDTFPGANREIDTAYNQAGILKDIIYPTGGKIAFQFETNRTTEGFVGGLRIKNITQYDSLTSKSLETEYRYTDGNGISTGYIQYKPKFWYEFISVSDMVNTNQAIRTSGDPVLPLFPNQGSPIIYTQVEKRLKSSSGDQVSRHFYEIDLLAAVGNSPEVQIGIGVPYNKYSNSSKFKALENKVQLFKWVNDTTLTIVQETNVDYSTVNNFKTYIWNVQAAWWYASTNSFIEWIGGDPYSTNPMMYNPSLNAYKLYQESAVKKSVSTTMYTPEGNLTNVEFYDYDSTTGNIRTIQRINSIGDTTITSIKYVTDYLYTGANTGINQQIDKLYDWNYLSAPIEILVQLKKKNSTVPIIMDAVLYEYENLLIKKIKKIDENIPINSFTPSNNNSTFISDSRYRVVQEIYEFDAHGKPLTINDNSNLTSYIWDYPFDKPIAVISNASNIDIAYSSFEGENKGNWVYGGNDGVASIVGEKGYNLDSGAIVKSGLNSSKIYNLTYWSKSGAFTVTGSSATSTLRTLNGWTLFRHRLSGVTSTSISGSGILDELRLYPEGAQMTSYNYEPLLGMVSVTDLNSRTNYYSYKGINKLFVIQDENRNIIKKLCYKFGGQEEMCNTYTSPIWRLTGNKRCKPCFSNSTFNTDTIQVLYRDFNPFSSTFNDTSWADNGVDSLCSSHTWQNINDSTRCIVDSFNQNTGIYEQKQIDVNPCGTYGSTRWTTASVDTIICPLPDGTYAKIAYENANWAGSTLTADIVIHFYRNQACTIPKSVTNLTVNYKIENTCLSETLTSIVCNGTSTTISLSVEIVYEISDNDPYTEYYITCNADYFLRNGTGYTVVQ